MDVFDKYAEYYDLLYSDKDYAKECDFVSAILEEHSPFRVETVLDVGCGTGNHAVLLAKRGYSVTGVDRSPSMLRLGKSKANQAGVKVDFHQGEILDFDLGVSYHSAICMFTVLGYLTTNSDVMQGLRNIRRHIDPGGLFICDLWNGLAVVRTLPEVRVRRIAKQRRRILRIAEPEIEWARHICWVNYRLLVTEDGRVLDEVEERHGIRFFFPQELTHYLESAGFEVMGMWPFPDSYGMVDDSVWTMVAVARASEI